jgi:heme oxygenase
LIEVRQKRYPRLLCKKLGYKVESERNLVAKLDDQERFVPQVDFSDPANFARYASAEKYYVDAIERIYKDYPYDGSEAEIQEFRNQENFVDRYIFEHQISKNNWLRYIFS